MTDLNLGMLVLNGLLYFAYLLIGIAASYVMVDIAVGMDSKQLKVLEKSFLLAIAASVAAMIACGETSYHQGTLLFGAFALALLIAVFITGMVGTVKAFQEVTQ